MSKLSACEKMTREEMLKEIQALEFALVELTLYLDICPTDKRAVCQYNVLCDKLNRTRTQFQMEYGPLFAYGEFPSKYPWEWASTPWPWEI